MKIDFRQPRYVLPLILLPFLLLFFHVYHRNFSDKKVQKDSKQGLQENLADVSPEVRNKSLADKLDAYRQDYRGADGYTAIGELELKEHREANMPDLYNSREKQLLDSLEQAAIQKIRKGRAPVSSSLQDQEEANRITNALAGIKQRDVRRKNPPVEEDPMQLFRKQMEFADSMARASDPEYQKEIRRKKAREDAEGFTEAEKTLQVEKIRVPHAANNTAPSNETVSFITAMIDQDQRSYQGSRVKLKLLDDIRAGNILIPAGSPVYAIVNSFGPERVNLKVSSLLSGNVILPVHLEIYDLDGLPGLYTPGSLFREFSSQLNASSGSALTDLASEGGNKNPTMSLFQKVFQSGSSVLNRAMKKNKAHPTYATRVYLIDPKELKNK